MISTALLVTTFALAAAPTPGHIGLTVHEDNGAIRVAEIDPNGPFASIARVGDIVVSVDDVEIASVSTFDALIKRTEPGDEVVVILKLPDGAMRGHRVNAIAKSVGPSSKIVIQDHRQPALRASAPASEPRAVATTTNDVPFVLASGGASAGDLAVGVGGIYFDQQLFLGLRIVYNLNPIISVDAEAQANGGSGFADIGMRVVLVDRGQFSLAGRVRLHEEHYLTDDGNLLLGGASVGTIASFGSAKNKATVGIDATVHAYEWDKRFKGDFFYAGYGFRPFVSFEHAAIDGANAFFEVHVRTLTISGSNFTFVTPGATIGVSW